MGNPTEEVTIPCKQRQVSLCSICYIRGAGLLLLLCLLCADSSLAFNPQRDSVDHGLPKTVDPLFENVMEDAERDAYKMQRVKTMSMEYCIFRGHAAVRDLDDKGLRLMEPKKWLVANSIIESNEHVRSAAYRAAAVLLLMRGSMDAAHEVLLGVTRSNIQEAEYAATHPGKTDWAKEHPLSDSADMLHAALHRLEGEAVGEGNHTGFENAKFWLAGGPKLLETPAQHSVRTQLAKLALENTPFCVSEGVVAPCGGAEHTIIAGGGKTRTVIVPQGAWDGFAFVKICKRWVCGDLTPNQEQEVGYLQRSELMGLLQSEIAACRTVRREQSQTTDLN